MADHSLALQGAVIAALLDDAGQQAVVGDRSYNEEPPPAPAWPFNRVEMGELLPDEATGWEGGGLVVMVHTFVMGPSARDCRRNAKRIARLLDGRTDLVLELEEDEAGEPQPRLLELIHVRTIVVRDADEPKGYHGVVEFNALTAEEA